MTTYQQALEVLKAHAGDSLRLDANETIALAKDLEARKARNYDVIYGENKEMRFMSIDSSAPAGAESITYRQWDYAGMAKVITNYADDLPNVAVLQKEFSTPVKTLGAEYDYSVFDLQRAALAGGELPSRKSRVARRVVENKVSEMIAIGHDQVKGLFNHANIPVATLPHTGAWGGLTADQILTNLHFLYRTVENATKETFVPNRCLMAPAVYDAAVDRYVDTTNRDTVLNLFTRQTGVTFEKAHRLDNAGAGGTDRVLMYNDSEEVLTFNLPVAYSELPPQTRGLSIVTPVWARVGAVEIHYPLALAYADVANP